MAALHLLSFRTDAMSFPTPALAHDAGGPTAKEKSSDGTAVRQDFCALDHSEGGRGIASMRPGPSGFANMGRHQPKGEAAHWR